MKTRVVHCKKSNYDIYIGRPGKWGNRFREGRDGTREECIAKFETWFRQQKELMAQLHELEGKILGCWCKPKPCHGDVYVKLLKERQMSKLIQIENENASPT